MMGNEPTQQQSIAASRLGVVTAVPNRRRRILRDDDAFVEVMARIVAAIYQETDAKIAALEAKIDGLHAAMQELCFVGQWQEFKIYKTGNFVSIGGQIYHANVDTNSRPGSDAT